MNTAKTGCAKAALFDCDGLLVATEQLFTEGEAEIFAAHDVEFTSEHKQQILGHALPELGQIVAEIVGSPGSGPQIAQQLLERVLHLVSEPIEPLPGVRELLNSLKGRAFRVVVSNSPRELVEATLCSAGLTSRVDAIVTLEDVAHPKPAADPYLRAAEIAGFPSQECVAFEDSPTGVRAALAAGARVIGVPATIGENIGATWHVATLDSVEALELIGELFDCEMVTSNSQLD